MENWMHIFDGAKYAVSSASSIDEAVALAEQFARRFPEFFEESHLQEKDEPAFWDRVRAHDLNAAFQEISKRAAQGLVRFPDQYPRQIILLDLGDCPEIFALHVAGAQEVLVSENKLGQIFQETLLGTEELYACCENDRGVKVDDFFGKQQTLADFHVEELKDDLMTWNGNESSNKGYLLWLVIGSFALLQQVKDTGLEKRLKVVGRKLHIVIGFEELFSHFATVGGQGMILCCPKTGGV